MIEIDFTKKPNNIKKDWTVHKGTGLIMYTEQFFDKELVAVIHNRSLTILYDIDNKTKTKTKVYELICNPKVNLEYCIDECEIYLSSFKQDIISNNKKQKKSIIVSIYDWFFGQDNKNDQYDYI